MATEPLHPSTDRRRHFLVCRSYRDYFPATEYASYDAFLNATVNRANRKAEPELFYWRGGQTGSRKNQYVRSSSKFTIILCYKELGPGFASLRPSKSSTACVTSDSWEVKEVSQSAAFEVVQSIWMSRFFSGHRYVLLRRPDSVLATPIKPS